MKGQSLQTFGEVFTFLFVTLGPLNIIGPFAAMTRGHDAAARRRIAFRAIFVAAIAMLVAASIGVAALRAWGITIGALLTTAGVVVILVALRPVLAGYTTRVQRSEVVPTPPEAALAFSPLAFPTIVTPYGLALLVLLFTLHPLGSGGVWVLGPVAMVLALDLLVMLGAEQIAKIPFIKPALDVLGCVMNVLLVALGVQVITDGFRLLS